MTGFAQPPAEPEGGQPVVEGGPRVTVLYIVGNYRSGTTLLSSLLGQHEDMFCVGEFRAIWEQLNDPDARCGCGAALTDCAYWRRILGSAFGGVAEARRGAPRLLAMQRQVFGSRHPWLRLPRLLRMHRLNLDAPTVMAGYADALTRLYLAIAAESGCSVIVDSSKEATDGSMVRLLPGMRAVFVHIVRDPRGNVWSVLRGQRRPASPTIPGFGRAFYVSLGWMMGNLAASALRLAVGPGEALLVRYEDLVAAPADVLGRIHGLAGVRISPPAKQDDAVTLQPTHTVFGNGNRFRTGAVRLEEDVAWRSGLSRTTKVLVVALCLPMMARFGYLQRVPLTRRGRSTAPADRNAQSVDSASGAT